jgi:hypothetical protein
MKVFMITWGLFCVLVIGGLFIAYATDQLPGVPATQFRSASPNGIGEDPDKSGQVGLEVEDSRNGAEAECSPCEENLKRLKTAMEQQAAREHEAKAAAGTVSDVP